MVVGTEDGPRWVAGGQILDFSQTVNVVEGATVDEVGRLVDNRSDLGIGAGFGGVAEGTAEVDNSKCEES